MLPLATTSPRWIIRSQLLPTINLQKKYRQGKHMVMACSRQGNLITELLVWTLRLRTAHSLLLSWKNILKVLSNASSLSRIWWVLPQVWHAGERLHSAPLLPPSSSGLQTKSELQASVQAGSKWLAHTPDAVLARTGLVKWHLKTLPSIGPFPRVLC